jgi:hypothetical protein
MYCQTGLGARLGYAGIGWARLAYATIVRARQS